MECTYELNETTRADLHDTLQGCPTLLPPGNIWTEPSYQLIATPETGPFAASVSWKHILSNYQVKCGITFKTPRLGNGFERCHPASGVASLAWMYAAWTHDTAITAARFLSRLSSRGMWTCTPGNVHCRRSEVLTVTTGHGMRMQAYPLGRGRHAVVAYPKSAPLLEWEESEF